MRAYPFRLAILVWMVGAIISLSSFAAPVLAAGQITALRQAIEDLHHTYGPKYSSAAEFLQRLDNVEKDLRSADSNVVAVARQEFARLQRAALIANPLVIGQPILFVVRQQYRPDHHNTATFFPNAENEYNDGTFTLGGALKAIDLGQGNVRTLLAVPHGVARDPEVHFTGEKVLFSMRTNKQDSYHIYEINKDGTRLRQLTFARDVDDLDPLYLPDDNIVFSSTREPKYCMCNRHVMANLYRMETDGANIHQIGKSTLFEGHGALMPDGRILYDRWEYVDRNFGDAQGLWTVNPDGTAHSVFWGNNTAAPGAVLDGRVIPGSEQFLCVFGSCHDRPWGALALVDRRLGLDGIAPVVRTWPAEATNYIRQSGWELFDAFTRVPLKYEDPFPLSEKYFLCSRMTGQGEQMGIYLIDLFGNEILLHTEAPGCFDPMPLVPHPRPPVLPTRRDYASSSGVVYVQDVYQGTHMAGVKRGSVKYLRVVESPEKRSWTRPSWNGQGQEAPAMNWHDFNNKRILGTVPVEPDGSAYFTMPAERFVYFQLLDADGLMVQSMRSGTLVQPGEKASCVGCHEDRRAAPIVNAAALMPSAGRQPIPLDDWYGPTRLFNYLVEVQPVWDKHCVRCHDFGKKDGEGLNLARDRDLVFNVSYNELWRKKMIQVVGAGPSDTQAAYSWGAHKSKLVQVLRKEHYEVRLNREEMDRVVTWIDLNGPYYPTYACAYPDHYAGRAPLDNKQLARLEQLTGVPLRNLADHRNNRGPQVSFDRPEFSPCLAKLSQGSPAYVEALAIIKAGTETLARNPEADMPGFTPCAIDQWRDRKYLFRRQNEDRARAALQTGKKVYDQPEALGKPPMNSN